MQVDALLSACVKYYNKLSRNKERTSIKSILLGSATRRLITTLLAAYSVASYIYSGVCYSTDGVSFDSLFRKYNTPAPKWLSLSWCTVNYWHHFDGSTAIYYVKDFIFSLLFSPAIVIGDVFSDATQLLLNAIVSSLIVGSGLLSPVATLYFGFDVTLGAYTACSVILSAADFGVFSAEFLFYIGALFSLVCMLTVQAAATVYIVIFIHDVLCSCFGFIVAFSFESDIWGKSIRPFRRNVRLFKAFLAFWEVTGKTIDVERSWKLNPAAPIAGLIGRLLCMIIYFIHDSIVDAAGRKVLVEVAAELYSVVSKKISETFSSIVCGAVSTKIGLLRSVSMLIKRAAPKINKVLYTILIIKDAQLRRKNVFSQLFNSRLIQAFRVARVFSRLSGSPASLLRRATTLLVGDFKRVSDRVASTRSSGYLVTTAMVALLLIVMLAIVAILI